MWLCHDGEISSSVIFVNVKRYGWGGGGVGSVMFASLGCKARVGVYSLLSYVGLQLLSVLFRWLMLKSFGYGFCGLDKKEKKK